MTRPARWTALALLALAACGGKEQPAPTPTATTAMTDAASPPEDGARREESVVVLVVDWRGDPLRGAIVTAAREAGGEPLARAETDATGRATLPSREVARASALGASGPPDREDLVRSAWEGSAARTIRLGRGFTVRGVVHDDRGEPVRAKVWIRWVVGRGPKYERSRANETDADGAFELRGLPYASAEIQATPASEIGPSELVYATWTTVTPESRAVVLTRRQVADVAPRPPINR